MNPKYSYFYLKAGRYCIFQPTNKYEFSWRSNSVASISTPQIMNSTLYMNGKDRSESYNFLIPKPNHIKEQLETLRKLNRGEINV